MRKVKILLTQRMLYVPTWGGANKSNRILLEELARRGHICQAVVPACGIHGCVSRESFRSELQARAIVPERATETADFFEYKGVGVTAVSESGRMPFCLKEEIRRLAPDWVLVASEDPGQILLRAALEASPARVVYLARTVFALPFGPASPFQAAGKIRMLRQTAGIVVVSRYLQEYLRRWAGLQSTELPISLCGPGPFRNYRAYDSGFVTLVNPCAYKGITIFLALANAFPAVQFAAVPTWGTTSSDHRQLESYSNIHIVNPVDDIDEVFASTRILIVPSLCAEGKARMIREAMLRGIPVLASDVGGNAEAMLGLDYLLPVKPIVVFRQEIDEKMLPVPLIPEQNVMPWVDALRTILENRECYEDLSAQSRFAAMAANKEQTIEPFENYLNNLEQRVGVIP